MKRLGFALLAALTAGCTTIYTATDYNGAAVEGGETPIETVEIENTGWLLFKCIPLGSGNVKKPNQVSCLWFEDSVTLQNNLDALQTEMKRVKSTRLLNLASRKTDESIFVILLTRRAYHTSAVLLK